VILRFYIPFSQQGRVEVGEKVKVNNPQFIQLTYFSGTDDGGKWGYKGFLAGVPLTREEFMSVAPPMILDKFTSL